jgi:hypothetical protein
MFPALINYAEGQEYSYGYSKHLDPKQHLRSYGMAFENNPFSEVMIPQYNMFRGFSQRQKDLCSAIGCLDNRHYQDLKLKNKVMHGGDNSTNIIYYQFSQKEPLNQAHLNLFRVWALDERAPG